MISKNSEGVRKWKFSCTVVKNTERYDIYGSHFDRLSKSLYILLIA